ncbi:MAG TPA: tetratricopeptide repeat protein, partial [Chitinophagaceae bacterium]|nr:tetratricopeptide repeat protein [Chitinophagaceae bacterium]
IFFMHCSCITMAQEKKGQARIDSLLIQLPKLSKDTGKVKLLNDLSDTYAYINANEGIKVGEQSLSLAQKLNWRKGIATAINSIGAGFEAKSDFPKALEHYLKALKLFEALGDKQGISKSLGNIGIVYDYQSDYPKALEYYFKVLRMREESGDKSGIAAFLGNIAVVYKNQSNYSKALEYSLKALDIYKELGDTYGIAINLNNIGAVYDNQSDYSKALEYYFKELKLLEDLADKDAIAVTLANIGAAYFSVATDSSNTISASQLNKPFSGNKIKLLQMAKVYTDSSINIFKELGHLNNLSGVYEQLSKIQTHTGDYKGALISYKNYATFKDSVFNIEKEKKITENAMQYEFDKKEAIAKAEQEKKDAIAERTRNLQYAAIGAFLLLGIFLLYGYTQKNKAKIKIEKAYTDLKSTQQQLIQSAKMASLGELTAGIAHEIQNPLNFVNNFSEVSNELLDEMKTELATGNGQEAIMIADDVKQNLEKILHHGKRADAIVKGMLQHSRLSTGHKESTDINALADEYLRLSYQGLRAKDKLFSATIITDYDKTIEKIKIIPQDVGRVLLNLYNNAFYAVKEKKKAFQSFGGEVTYEPTVSVSTKKINSPSGVAGIEIHVRDNGNGIPEKISGKIFQPFFTTKPTGSGTGLGLSLSYDIIKAHGGELKVETKEGEYAEFIVRLPHSS